MTALSSSVAGVGKLLSQKLMFADSILGLHLGTNWLAHCIPGSDIHFKRLKERPFNFKFAHQVPQLVHCIAQRLNILPLKAEEILCKTLKTHDSKYWDVVFQGQSLYFVARNDDGEIVVFKVDGITCEVTQHITGGYDWNTGSHYYPSWMSRDKDFSSSGNIVHMASLANKGILSKKRPTSVNERKEYDACIPRSMASNFSLDDAQTLLNKGQYLSIKQPLHFAATHLGIPVSLLEDSIMV